MSAANMVDLDGKEWGELIGGYKVPYDPSPALKTLEAKDSPDEAVWNALWNNLYHQGDVGSASYAAVPQLLRIYKDKGWVDYNLPSFTAAIEAARLTGNNPDVPDWLSADYEHALLGTTQYCFLASDKCDDRNFRRAFLMLVSIVLQERETYELLDVIAIGDERKAIECYEGL